jgi:hypothetical protein
VTTESLVKQDQRDRRVHKEALDPKVIRAIQGLKDQRGQKVTRVTSVTLDQRDPKAILEPKARKAIQEQRDQKAM